MADTDSQGFEYGLIMDVHEQAAREMFEATDDAMLAERYGYRVRLVDGQLFPNIKVTTKDIPGFCRGAVQAAVPD